MRRHARRTAESVEKEHVKRRTRSSRREKPELTEKPGLKQRRDLAEVVDEAAHLFVAGGFVGRAEDRGGMHSGHDVRRERGLEKLAAMLRDAKIAAEEGLRSRGAETHDHFGPERGDLGFEPRTAGCDFGGVGLFVDAAFAAGLPLEMFYGVRDIDFLTVDASFDEGGVEELACRSDEGTALEVFLISRLFADEHDF